MFSLSSSLRSYWAAHPDYAQAARTEGVDLDSAVLPIKAVLFDMDGVLFDSMPAHAESWASTCAAIGLELSAHEVYMNEGRTAHSTINMLTQRQYGRDTTPEEVERIYALKCTRFNEHPEAPKMAGAEDVLRAVQAAHKTIVVVTGSGQASLLDRLTTHYPGFFSPQLVVSSKDVQHGKPHPEPYLMGLEKAGQLRPWEALVVENAPLGVRAAVAAGCFTIAVNTGPLDPSALTDEGANVCFPSMSALAEVLPSFFTAPPQPSPTGEGARSL